jgi:hypothetical protein
MIWIFNKRVNWLEWVGACALSFAVAGIMHFVGINGMTSDTETWSGFVTEAYHVPRWKERYTEHHSETYTTTDSDGNKTTHTRHWTTTEYRWHDDEWHMHTTLGNSTTDVVMSSVFDFSSGNISKSDFDRIVRRFGSKIDKRKGDRTTSKDDSKMVEGDPYDYHAVNVTGWIEPVTTTKSFENRVKAAPTTLSFAQVPENIPVYEYPSNGNQFLSDRVVGHAVSSVGLVEWDQLNARLGALKKVNLIVVGWKEGDQSLGEWQRAKWIGGKKNDLVICFGGDPRKPDWVYVFGWTEREDVKQNLTSILSDNGISTATIPLIEAEVKKNYTIKDWHKFDYITIPYPMWAFWVFIGLQTAIQGGFWAWCHLNEFEKGEGAFSIFTRIRNANRYRYGTYGRYR